MKSNEFISVRSIHVGLLIVSIGALFFSTYYFMDIPTSYTFLDIGVLSGTMMVFSQLVISIQRNYHPSIPFNFANSSLIGILIGLSLLINHLSIKTQFKLLSSNELYLVESIFPIKLIVVALFFVLILYILWVDRELEQAKKIKAINAERERESIEFELKNLQSQFKPHFLFNSLNSINALTTTNPSEAQKMILLLSEYMRGTVSNDKSQIVRLEKELKHVQLYTDIESVRFGNRLKVTYKVPEELNDKKIPYLILQPIIENAIKYGLYDTVDEVEILISAQKTEDYLKICVRNPFDENTQMASKGTGFGLKSIQKKLALMYGSSHLLSTESENHQFITTLLIPQ